MNSAAWFTPSCGLLRSTFQVRRARNGPTSYSSYAIGQRRSGKQRGPSNVTLALGQWSDNVTSGVGQSSMIVFLLLGDLFSCRYSQPRYNAEFRCRSCLTVIPTPTGPAIVHKTTAQTMTRKMFSPEVCASV